MEHASHPADLQRLYSILCEMDMHMMPPLSQRVCVEEYARKLTEKAEIYYIIYEGQDCGHCAVYMNSGKKAFISSLVIHTKFQGMGMAHFLLRKVIGEAKKRNMDQIGLEVHRDNKIAYQLYCHAGFQRVAEQGELIVMKKDLQEPDSMDKIFVTRSSVPSYEVFIERIKPLWETRQLTNMGIYHKELEQQLKAYLGVPGLSLMVNGHMALEMAIQAMGFSEGSEVITTPFTFISTTHAIVRNRLTPVFCDIKPDDYTIDEEKLEELITEKTVAIVPVHVYGNICNVERIEEIAYKHGLKVIYDACHAFGETYMDKGVGAFGDASVFSFHATKVFNTIEGGAVAFSNEELYEKLYNLKNFGIRGEELVAEVGANAKMNEFSAIMGLCNLPEVGKNIALRKERAEAYIDLLKKIPGLTLPDYTKRKEIVRNYGYFPILVPSRTLRDQIYNDLRQQDIYARKYFYPLTTQAACFGGKYDRYPLPNAKRISETVLVLPLYPELEYEDIEKIAEGIKKSLGSSRETRCSDL